MTEESKEPGICPGSPVLTASSSVLYSVLGTFSGAFFFIVVFSYGRNADISSGSNVVPEENKSFTDKGGNQSWKHNSIQTFAKNYLLALRAWPHPGGNTFLPGALQNVPETLELERNNVLLPFSFTSGTVLLNAEKFHSVLNSLSATCTLW